MKLGVKILIIIFVILIGIGIFYLLQKEKSDIEITESSVCKIDEDCVHFGKTGECNCGCYIQEDLPIDTDGECFCVAPTSCKCVDSKCEGVFE